MTTQQTIERKLTTEFSPSYLEVINESGNHNVPKGSESHFLVKLVSQRFTGLPLLARHRLVNAVLADELAGAVHALTMRLYTAQEWQQSGGETLASPPCLGGSAQEQGAGK
ncbi:MAG: BolA/IbaG family iron-sulfur metabolism protein [Gammaproteobacteria bacterium]|nr:BolA/IbaG family iron-sulfur metabolism protein [Gammaproteobacteria bacterium]